MQWFIIGRDMHVLCTPSTDLPQTLPIDDSGDSLGQEISITNNSAVGTYDFTTDPRNPDAVYITEGNYIAFRDKYGKDRLYTIMSIEGDEKWTVHCEDIGLDLINEYAVPWDYTARSIEDTLSVVLHDSGWEIGINEVSSYKRATEFEGTTDSQLTRIGDVCNQFDAECEFAIEMKGAKVTKQVINIYKTLGEDKTQQRFIDNINLISLSRSGSIEDLITCIRCYGKEDENGNKLTIADISYDDGRYFSPKGEHRIYDRDARNKWSRFRAYDYEGQGEFDGYIVGTFEYDTDDANELLNRGLTELKSRNDVKVTYEASLYDLRADIGDTVQIADNRFQEKVYLSARIQSVRNHYTVSGQDSGVLANYKILTSNPTSQVTQIMEQLKDQIVSVKSTEITYQIGSSGVEAPTGAWLTDPPQTQPGDYLWTRKITTYTNNSQTLEYSVSRNGNDGEKGEQGKPGVDGKSSYTHIAYANSADGRTDFSVSDPDRDYIGMYVDSKLAGSTDPTDYAWSKIKGADGTQGIPGKAGADGKTPYLHIAYANSADGKTGFSITDSANKLYIGQYTDYTSADSTNPAKYSWSRIKGEDGKDGADGVGIEAVEEYYAVSTSNTTAPSTWSKSVPTMTTTNKYLWNYEKIIYSDETFRESEKRVIGVYGNTGSTGAQGNGISSITNYYLASTAASGVTTATSGWTTTMQTTTTSKKYLWNYEKITYTNGTSVNTTPVIIGTHGATGPTGATGADGKDGRGVKSSAVTYQASSSGTSVPTGTWSSSVPSVSAGQYLWTRTVITYTDGTTTILYSVGRMGSNGSAGAAGKGVSSITEYYLASASSSGVTISTSGWTTKIQTITTSKKYLWNYEVVKYTDGSSTTTSPVIIGAYGNTGATGAAGAAGEDGLPGGAVNLLKASNVQKTSTNYMIGEWAMTRAPKPGEKWTLIAELSYNNSAENGRVDWYVGQSSSIVATFFKTKNSRKIVVMHGTGRTNEIVGNWVRLYNYPSGSQVTATVYWICMYEGHVNPSSSWTPSAEELKGETGATGNGIKTITNYYLATTASSGVTTSTSGWTTTIQSITSSKRYLWNYEVVTYTNGSKTTTAPHIIGVYGNTGNTGATGATGADGKDGQMLYATCGTAAATAAKVATLAAGSLTLKAGVTVSVKFTYSNTASSPTLNVAGTGAKAIYTQGVRYAYWRANSTVVFTYDGSYWRVASEPVYANTATIGNPGGANVYLDSNTVNVRQGSANRFTFGNNGERNYIKGQGIYLGPKSPDESGAGSTPHLEILEDKINTHEGEVVSKGNLSDNVQAFSISVSISKANTWETQVVKFPKAFSKAPVVIVQAQTGQSGTLVWADGATTTQFTLHKYRPSTTAFGAQVIAVAV